MSSKIGSNAIVGIFPQDRVQADPKKVESGDSVVIPFWAHDSIWAGRRDDRRGGGEAAPPFAEGPVNPRDPDASFTIKNDKTYFGYKAHLAMDEESDLIRQAEMTSADVHDSQRGEAMIQGDEEAYYADKAYDSNALREKLASLGIADKIAYKAQRRARFIFIALAAAARFQRPLI